MVRTQRLRPFVLAGALLAIPACSFLVETSGLQGDAPDAGVASIDGRADGPTFVETDGATTEGGVEGGTDATGGRLCADAGTAICDDFDDSTTLASSWERDIGNGSATVVGGGLSAPNALELKINAPGTHAHVYRTIPFAKAVRCDVDMKFLDPPTGSEIDYLVIHTDAQNHNLYLAHFDGKFALAEWKESGVDRTVDVAAPAIGKWIHVVLATDGKSLSLQMDGTSYTLSNIVDVNGPNRQLVFGMWYAAGNGATRVLYDNIRCTTGP